MHWVAVLLQCFLCWEAEGRPACGPTQRRLLALCAIAAIGAVAVARKLGLSLCTEGRVTPPGGYGRKRLGEASGVGRSQGSGECTQG